MVNYIMLVLEVVFCELSQFNFFSKTPRKKQNLNLMMNFKNHIFNNAIDVAIIIEVCESK